jgi:hypothetical protein
LSLRRTAVRIAAMRLRRSRIGLLFLAGTLLGLLLALIVYVVSREAEHANVQATEAALVAAISPTPETRPTVPTPDQVRSPTAAAAPTVTATATAAPVAAQPVTAQVFDWAGGLRLRVTPGTAGEVLFELPALALLTVIGRTEESAWLQVITPSEHEGWVSADYVSVSGDVEALEVTGTAVAATSGSTSYLSGVTAHARAVYLSGRQLGKRHFAFSVVGDSNTANPAFLAPYDLGNYDLGPFSDYSLTIHYYSGSFARQSAAAQGGFSTARVLDPAYADGRCAAGETPLACEYRLHQPSAALILLGTGDQHTWEGFEARYRQIIEYSLQEGVVPVLITKADDLESLENTAPPGYINSVIRRLAREYDVPLLDLRQAVEGLPNRGCLPDGFHFNSPPDGQTANFNDGYLEYGFNVRNQTALEALDALRRFVLYAPATDS